MSPVQSPPDTQQRHRRPSASSSRKADVFSFRGRRDGGGRLRLDEGTQLQQFGLQNAAKLFVGEGYHPCIHPSFHPSKLWTQPSRGKDPHVTYSLLISIVAKRRASFMSSMHVSVVCASVKHYLEKQRHSNAAIVITIHHATNQEEHQDMVPIFSSLPPTSSSPGSSSVKVLTHTHSLDFNDKASSEDSTRFISGRFDGCCEKADSHRNGWTMDSWLAQRGWPKQVVIKHRLPDLRWSPQSPSTSTSPPKHKTFWRPRQPSTLASPTPHTSAALNPCHPNEEDIANQVSDLRSPLHLYCRQCDALSLHSDANGCCGRCEQIFCLHQLR